MRLKISIAISKIAGFASQKLLGKSGATIPGYLLLKIYPKALVELGKNRIIVLVSGTNGKTSTTRALTKLISQLGTTVSNGTGSNLDRGVATALMKKSEFAVLEVDELHLINVAKALNPRAILLLNLTRDQLHRMHEVKKVSQRWHDLAGQLPSTLFIGDIDDPFVSYALSASNLKKSISFGGRPHEDGAVCPACGTYLNWSSSGYKCSCGLSNQGADIKFSADSAAMRNALMANAVGEILGAQPGEINKDELERAVTKDINNSKVKIRLTKNPASWREALSGLSQNKIILILNAREVDGIDTSWLWDIDFSTLAKKEVVVTGERALDLMYRLHVQGINAKEVKTFSEAVNSFASGSNIETLAAYTAFHAIAGAN